MLWSIGNRQQGEWGHNFLAGDYISWHWSHLSEQPGASHQGGGGGLRNFKVERLQEGWLGDLKRVRVRRKIQLEEGTDLAVDVAWGELRHLP